MELSIVIVNWNTRELILRCLDHLMGLDLPAPWEVWVVDNGSQDGSAQAVRAAFPQVNLVENGRNLGFAGANNQALERSRGNYLLLLNSDCFPEPGAITSLREAMIQDPRVGIAGGGLSHPDGRPQHAFGAAPTLATELLHKGLLQVLAPLRFPSKRQRPQAPMEVETVLGAFLMVRREAFLQVGGLDEGYFFFLEETDWCLRMRRAGWKVLHVPGARAMHLQGESTALDLANARVEFYRSRYRFFSIHRSAVSLALLRWGLLARGFVNWVSSGVLGGIPGAGWDSWRRRHEVDRAILLWHLKGCPEGWGLDRSSSLS
jgi:GT2 family glycosyltransferase